MKITKIIPGYVAQDFDTDTGQFTKQEFVPDGVPRYIDYIGNDLLEPGNRLPAPGPQLAILITQPTTKQI